MFQPGCGEARGGDHASVKHHLIEVQDATITSDVLLPCERSVLTPRVRCSEEWSPKFEKVQPRVRAVEKMESSGII
jgi:hypothetical protein